MERRPRYAAAKALVEGVKNEGLQVGGSRSPAGSAARPSSEGRKKEPSARGAGTSLELEPGDSARCGGPCELKPKRQDLRAVRGTRGACRAVERGYAAGAAFVANTFTLRSAAPSAPNGLSLRGRSLTRVEDDSVAR